MVRAKRVLTVGGLNFEISPCETFKSFILHDNFMHLRQEQSNPFSGILNGAFTKTNDKIRIRIMTLFPMAQHLGANEKTLITEPFSCD